MHIEYINKNIVLENIINDINLINIEDNVQYLNRNDGVLIKGYIDIECEYISLGVIKYFKDKAEVSILVPYENIITNELLLKIKDFDYYIKDNTLALSFKINIEGYKEIEKSFQNENEEMEIVSNVNVNLDDVKEYLNNEEEIIVLNDIIIPEIKEEIEEVKEEIISNEDKEENIEEVSNVVLENKDNVKEIIEDEGKRLEFNINGEELIKYIDTSEKLESKGSFLDSLFKKEKKVRMWKYRVVLENDTYENIARENNINLFKLREINNNTSLELGKIIKIPNRYE